VLFPHLGDLKAGLAAVGDLGRAVRRAIALHAALPEQMPLSWALFEPVEILGLYLLMLVLPLIDPWRRSCARFDGVYRLLRWLTVLFMSGVCAISRADALGYDVDAVLLLDVGTALLFIVNR